MVAIILLSPTFKSQARKITIKRELRNCWRRAFYGFQSRLKKKCKTHQEGKKKDDSVCLCAEGNFASLEMC